MENMAQESMSEKDRINESISELREKSRELLERLGIVNDILIKRSDSIAEETEKTMTGTEQGWLLEINDRLKVIKRTMSECNSFADPIVRALQSKDKSG